MLLQINLDHLSAMKAALSLMAENNSATYELTQENLKEDVSEILYYANGVEVFKNSKSINTPFEAILGNTNLYIIDFIKKHFNKKGFKGLSKRLAMAHLNQQDYGLLAYESKRYDFIEKDGEVFIVERYQINKYKKRGREFVSTPHFIATTTFRVKGGIEGVNIEAVEDNTYFIEPENFPQEIQSYYDLKEALGKTPEKIDDNLTERLSRFGIITEKGEQENNKWEWLLAEIAPIFYKVFPSYSYDMDYHTFNHKSAKFPDGSFPIKHKRWVEESIRKYFLHPITMLAALLGIPNQCELGEEPSWENIGWNMLGWKKTNSDIVNTINDYLTPFTLLKNVLWIIYAVVYSTLRLFSELLPLALAEGCKRIADFALEQYQFEKAETAFAYALLYGLALSLRFLFEGIYCIGRAITSPFDSVRAAWNFALTVNKSEHIEEAPIILIARIMLAVVLVLISAGITATIYTLAFPFYLKMLAVVVPDLAILTEKISTAIFPALSFVGNNFIIPALGKLAEVIGAALTPVSAGFFVAIAVSAVLGGMLVKTIVNFVRKLWETAGDEDDVEVKPIVKHEEESMDEEVSLEEEKSLDKEKQVSLDSNALPQQATNPLAWKDGSRQNDEITFENTGNSVFSGSELESLSESISSPEPVQGQRQQINK